MTYILGALLIQCLPPRIERRLTIIISFVLSSISLLFVGPSSLFSFKDSLGYMIAGQLLFGFSLAFSMVPILPEMSNSALEHYHKSVHERVNNMASGMFTFQIGLGSCLGPIFGSIFY